MDGNVTLRLRDVPWDQALDLVMKAKGLGKRQEGNIIRVAPLDELNKQEQDELQARKIVEDLEPLRTEVFQINYTTAEDIKKILIGVSTKTAVNTGGPLEQTKAGANPDVNEPITSSRGNITSDPRTNQLIVMETSRNLDRIRDLIRQLDKPVRQVLIE